MTTTSTLTHVRAPWRTPTALAFAAIGAAILAVWGDPFGLQLAGYLPILLGGWIVGSDGVPGPGQVFGDWALWRSLITLAAAVGAFWLARRAWPRRHLLGTLSDARLHSLLRACVIVAALCPTFYAVTRIAWVVGIPLGLSPEFLTQIQPIVANGLVLGVLALVGAVLTIGLVRPWGETFPRWIPYLGGKAVPVGFARNFALCVAFLVAAAGAYFIRSMITGAGISIAPPGSEQQWGAWLPEMVWPLWALTLAVAATAYAERRRRVMAPTAG